MNKDKTIFSTFEGKCIANNLTYDEYEQLAEFELISPLSEQGYFLYMTMFWEEMEKDFLKSKLH